MAHSVRAGMCVQIQASANGTWHLYVVITEPFGNPLEVAVVNFTSYRPNIDETAVFEAGDHPNLTKKSMINYLDGKVVLVDALAQAIQDDPYRVKADCGHSMLKRIQDGLSTTRAVRPKFKVYCDGKF